jgi:lysozyme
MKKTFISLAVPIVVLSIFSYLLPTPQHVGMSLSSDIVMTLPVKDIKAVSSPLVQEELNYYLDRHNMEDEGYEMVLAFANGKRLEMETDYHLPVRNVGRWQGHHREGTTIVLDSLGRTVLGNCRSDTLEVGIRIDSIGSYFGEMRNDKADGHGAYLTPDGSYFEGRWENDLRQGFGLELLTPFDQEPRLRVGEWGKNRYQGERMRYTTERIYGIDIARYQHGKGRRPVPIRWNELRITHVGKRGSHNVRGTADYPVSFVYIKSTEGVSVRNKFYPSDYVQARRHGIHTGAYHFWSVRTSGAAQAEFFLKNTHFRQGDLPPVLDIEPSNSQINQMGGAEVMFRHIRTWLKMVEKRIGVKPILYVNQTFVNNYLTKEADLKRDYRIWIARYSEYKPDLHLIFWQLCPDGRVAGIKGDVDINVFNGYKSQFEDFLEEETIR